MKKYYILFVALFLSPFTFFVSPVSAQIITTFAGNNRLGYSGDGGQATAAEMRLPTFLKTDKAGNVYFSDYDNVFNVRKVSTTGIISSVVGNGWRGYTGDGGPATAAEISDPYGVTVDTTGNLYIADYGNYRIRMVNKAGIISTVAGNGVYGYTGDGGQATAAELRDIYGICTDLKGNLYLTEQQTNVIRMVNTLGIITTVAGTGVSGFSGDGGPATAAKLANPDDVAVDNNGNIYINDVGNGRVRKINKYGIISTVAGSGLGYNGNAGPATAMQIWASGITLDAAGELFIADGNNELIRKVDLSGYMTSIGGSGYTGYTGNGGPATAAELDYPYGITVDANNNIYFSDMENSVIRKITTGYSDLLTQDSSSNCSICNGAAIANTGGGTPPYTYLWTPNSSTSSSVTAACPGVYSVTIVDGAKDSIKNQVVIVRSTIIKDSTGDACAGCCDCHGRAWITPYGGVKPYTYLWSNSKTTDTITGLAHGTYTVTVTDASGCTAVDTAHVSFGVPASVSSTNITCNGNNNGTATATGGTSYSWSPGGQTTASINGLSAGTYNVTITNADSGGCMMQKTVVITQPQPLSVTVWQGPTPCYNGPLYVYSSESGGTPPYTFSWSATLNNTQDDQVIETCFFAVYSDYITVTDNNGCVAYAGISFFNQIPVDFWNTSQTNSTCNGANNGSITLTGCGGSGYYQYNFSPGGSYSNAGPYTLSNLSAGTYTVNISTGNFNCPFTNDQFITITQPTALVVNASGTQNVLCYGGSTGSASSTVSGGTAPYTYSWSPSGGSGSSATGLTAGTYTLNVTDNNGCTGASNAITITQPATPLSIYVTGSPYYSCNSTTAVSSATASGGTPGYLYDWSPFYSGGLSWANVNDWTSCGTFTVTVTDANGCTASAPYSVLGLQPNYVTAVVNFNITCGGGNDGVAYAYATCGTGVYAYSWAPSGGSNYMATALSAGTYTVTVTDNGFDAYGCSETASVTITAPPAVSVTTTVTASSCSSNNGTATASASNGVLPYTYLWSNGKTTTNITGLSSGTYTINVTDNNGCTGSATATITQTNGITVSASVTSNIVCNGGSTGSASSTVSGGTAPYTYTWSNSQTTPNISGLSYGTYTVNVTDNAGCTGSASVAITQPNQLNVLASVISNVSCNGYANGSASSATAGGTVPYTYSWSGGGGTNSTATGLSYGTYTITVNDSCGATATASVLINQPPVLNVAGVLLNNVGCYEGLTGAVTQNVTGGVGPYTYEWSPTFDPETGPYDYTGIPAGSYTVIVFDANGCTASATVSVSQPNQLNVSANTTSNVLCYGGSTGSASSTVSGGTTPYTYSWSNSQTTPNTSGLSYGTYTLNVTDNNGCTGTASVTITQPAPLSIVADSAADNGSCNGAAWVAVGGGTSPYTYFWTGGNTTDSIGSQCHGYYCCNVTDANGCMDSVCINVILYTANQRIVSNSGEVSVYPNPNNGQFIISFSHPQLVSGPQIIEIYNVLGEKVYSDYQIMKPSNYYIDLRSKPNGIYFYRILNNIGSALGEGKIIIQK